MRDDRLASLIAQHPQIIIVFSRLAAAAAAALAPSVVI